MPLTPTRAAVAQDLGERAQLILGTAYGASQNITGATNATPIVLTVTAHGYTTGAIVTVADVRGNTAANGRWQITRVDANTFQLNGSAGNAAYVSSTGIVASGTGVAGYYLSNNDRGSSLKIKPQQSRSQSPVYIGAANYLTMRDSDWYSRVYLNDLRGGCGQITVDATDPKSKWRYFDCLNLNTSQQGIISPVVDSVQLFSGDTLTTAGAPMCIANNLLYLGVRGAVKYSTSYSGAPSSAATSNASSDVLGLCTDGTFVYGAASASGIDKWTINSTTQATSLNTTSASPKRVIFANQRIYAISATIFYEVAIASGTGTTNQAALGGWVFQDLCAGTGGAINAQVYVLGTMGTSVNAPTYLWQWDGTTFRDYITSFPSGFTARRIKQYLGVIYVTGYVQGPLGNTVQNVVYAIVNGQLSFIGYLGVPQSNGDPGDNMATDVIPMDFSGTGAYFLTTSTSVTQNDSTQTNRNEIWRYDIVTGGLSRMYNVPRITANVITGLGDLCFFNNYPWSSYISDGVNVARLCGSAKKFAVSAKLVTSDQNLGQPWAVNMWVTIEVSHSPLLAGESVQTEYSTDSGVTWTSAGTQSTVGATADVWTISSSTSSVKGPYIRMRMTLTSGTSQLTAPQVYSITLKADPSDPTGGVIEAYVSCADASYMPKGGPDWQGLSGQERMQLIIDLFNLQSLTTLIYMGSNTTRAKNPTTVTVNVTNYEIEENASVGLGPEKTVEGTVKVEMRIV